VFSTLLSALPVLILWYLDRRERESPWLFAAAFLWGGLIATTLALPANTAVIFAVAQWLEHNAALKEMLGPDAAMMIGAPLATRSVGRPVRRDSRAYMDQFVASLPRTGCCAGRWSATGRNASAAGSRTHRGDDFGKHLQPGHLPAVRAAAGLDHPP
jgi:hypothetical protein